MTWQATLKPYKHQINDLGRVDIVIWAEKIFFCCENSGVREGKTRREGPDPTLPSQPSKKTYLLWEKLFSDTPVSDIGERLDGASN